MLKISHIALSVSDLDKSIVFYRKNFGLKCKEKFHIKPSGLRIALLKKNMITLELFEFEKHIALPKYRKNLDSDLKTLGTKHFAFAVEDIERTYKNLKKNKVDLVTDIRTFEDSARYFFIKDPDGILVEIIEAR